MPNWCENDVIIRGSQDEIRRIKAMLEGENGPIDFNKLLPYPSRFEEATTAAEELSRKQTEEMKGMTQEQCVAYRAEHGYPRDGYNQGGHEWCIANWGTKWNASNPQLQDEAPQRLCYTLETAWAPPVPVFKELSKHFPEAEITLDWYEGGMAMRGTVRYRGGRRIYDQTHEYHGQRGG